MIAKQAMAAAALTQIVQTVTTLAGYNAIMSAVTSQSQHTPLYWPSGAASLSPVVNACCALCCCYSNWNPSWLRYKPSCGQQQEHCTRPRTQQTSATVVLLAQPKLEIGI